MFKIKFIIYYVRLTSFQVYFLLFSCISVTIRAQLIRIIKILLYIYISEKFTESILVCLQIELWDFKNSPTRVINKPNEQRKFISIHLLIALMMFLFE